MADGEDPRTPALRASDAERERTATQLREHCAAGRLTADELDERLDAAYSARTRAELTELVADLPAAPEPAPAPARRAPARDHLLHAAGLAVLACVACTAIWLATGADGSFWPKWVFLAAAIRLAFAAWGALGPGAASHEARHGRGGAQVRRPEHPER